jgi:capsule polysaccharide export protein KpsE/RkpR
MDERFSFAYFVDIIVRRWKLFLGVAFLAVAVSALLSGPSFIRPRYRSMAIVYPVNLTSYSIETRADQLLQLMESNSIRDSLIQKFDLRNHYRIDTAQVSDRHILYNVYKERVEISKTRYESVQVEVTDEDPVVARDMVQAILDQVNLLARRLQREKSQEVLRIAERSLSNTKDKLAEVEQRLDTLRNQSGLLAYDAQTKELTKAYMKLLTSGGSQAQKEAVQKMLTGLETKGGEFRSLTDLSNMFRGEYTKSLEEYEHAVNDMTKVLTYTNVVVYPEIPDKKVYPLRWLIVLVALVSAVFLCFLLVAVRDRGLWKPATR